MSPTIFLDLETTGVHLTRRPWEIAFIIEDTKPAGPHGAVRQVRNRRELVVHITDIDLSDADPKGLEVGGFYQRHVDHAPAHHTRYTDTGLSPAETALLVEEALADGVHEPGGIIAVEEATAAHLVRRWCSPTPRDRANMVGLNTWFDVETLAWMLSRHDCFAREPWNYHLVNIANEAAGWLRGQLQLAHQAAITTGGMTAAAAAPVLTNTLAMLEQLPRHSVTLSRLCGVEPPGPGDVHTGLGDARWVARWWDVITAGPSPRPWFTPHPAPAITAGRSVNA